MRALVVGGSGLVGAAVAQALVDGGAEVVSASRSGSAPIGEPLVLDVRRRDLGLGPHAASLAAGLTHIVSCFGSAELDTSARSALDTHLAGTRNLLAFAGRCPQLQRFVHVSSVLVFGRATDRLGNRELDVGQGFRSWYEYGKFTAEAAVRAERAVGWRVIRLGPVLGTEGPVAPSPRSGLPSVLPHLLRGYPVHLADFGRFPCHVGDVTGAAEVIARGCELAGGGETWTWFDPERPTLAAVLGGLCAAWGIVPRIVDMPLLRRLTRLGGRRLGMPETLLNYSDRWVELPAELLDALPFGAPACPPGYIERTGASLRNRSLELAA